MKRYMYIVIVVIIICVIFLNVRKTKTLPTIAIPSTNRSVIIDAGHGLPDAGAVGYECLTVEKINLSIAMKLQKLLESSGTITYLTRSDENGIYDINSKSIKQKKISDIKNRVELINKTGSEILISIHLNKFSDNKYSGWQVFYRENSEESNRLADCIQNSINKNIDRENKRITKPIKDIYIIDNSKIPAVIVECGFISNPEEAILLQDETYQNKIVWGIYIGIQEYFKE